MKNDKSNRPKDSSNRYVELATAAILIAMLATAYLTFSGCSSDDDDNGDSSDTIFDTDNPNLGTEGVISDNGGSGGAVVGIGEPVAGIQDGIQDNEPEGPACGNGQIDPGEDCELDSPVAKSCESLGYPGGGQVSCDPTCQFNVAGCRSSTPSTDEKAPNSDDGDSSDEVDTGKGVDTIEEADKGADTVVQTGTLPVPDTLDGAGPFEVLDVPNTGPGNQFELFTPQPLGKDGIKHPIVAWSPGAMAFPAAYLVMLKSLASQGFVTLSYNTTAQGPNLVAAIDWLIAENGRQGSELYGMLDTEKIAAGGHSAGSLATYQMADDPRLTTTLHMSGGSFTPQADVPRLCKPALMVCGGAGGNGLTTGDMANPNCEADFELATVPVFFAVVEGGGHTALNDANVTAGMGTGPDDPKKKLFIKAMVGWLRWQLADDQSLKKMFVGDDCELCAPGSGYIVKQKDLN